MTKEIIIDGVKVEECSYYNKDNAPYCCEIWDNECEAQNCYFKQCKRLEQENERLKEEAKIKDNISEDFRKKALEWAEIANNYFKENSRLYKTLQEIKEIAENEIKELTDSAINGGRYLEILNLIKKAEEE